MKRAVGFVVIAAACGAPAKHAAPPPPPENTPKPAEPKVPSCTELVDLQLKIMLGTPGLSADDKSELRSERNDAITTCEDSPPSPEVATCMAAQTTMDGMKQCASALPEGLRAPTADDLATFTASLPGTGNGPLTATIDTQLGTIHCTLFGDKTPITVANFVGLATGQLPWLDPRSKQVQTGKPFYDGLVFHRVVPGFMIQGGDPLADGSGGPGYAFADEIVPDLTFDKAGVLAMANAGADTNGSQFFITEAPELYLNSSFTIFGQCSDSDVVHKIATVPVTMQSEMADNPVVIEHVTISK